jgi:hypothetical protein
MLQREEQGKVSFIADLSYIEKSHGTSKEVAISRPRPYDVIDHIRLTMLFLYKVRASRFLLLSPPEKCFVQNNRSASHKYRFFAKPPQ